ncbi:MAG: oxygenase MpaB family protein [Chryseolinea sp.]
MKEKTSGVFLDRQRHVGDPDADNLFAEMVSKKKLSDFHKTLSLSEKELHLLNTDQPMKAFILGKRAEPEWVDDSRVLRGQEIFDNHAFPIMTLLGLMSLPYCYAASPGNKALFMAEKMRQSPAKRITDTAQFTIDVLKPGNLQSNRYGFVQIRKTRLIHAMARHYISKAEWNQDWGVPINQEDMAGTNLAFSYIILVGLQSFGVMLSMKEKEDFIFTWKYIGYQLGINEKLLPDSFKEAEMLTEVIKRRHFKKTEEGVILTQELVKYLETVVPQRQAYFVKAQIKYFLGREVAGYLGLPDNRIKDKIIEATNSVKEIQNFFTIPKKSLNLLFENYKNESRGR